MAKKDYYEILEVSREASASEIKRQFRKKAREYHPDVNKEQDAEERFKEINEAYDVLSDDKKRAHYDRFGSMDGMNGYSSVDFSDIFGGGFGMDDIFSTFFGGMGGMGRQAVRMDGRNMQIGLRLTLQEVATGVEKEIVFDRLAPCDTCSGSGVSEGGSVVTCPTCQGSGHVTTIEQTFLGRIQTSSPCPECRGSGQSIENPCPDCEGQGRLPDREHVTIEVPAGIHEGQHLKVTGFGEAGIRGASSGDLLVQVHILPDEYFVREGDHLRVRATVSIAQAALGSEIEVNGILPDEMVTVQIPAGCQDDQLVRVKGKGMPIRDTDRRGDLVVHVDVEVPRSLTQEQRDLLEQLAKTFDEKVGDTRTPWQKFKDTFV